MYAFTYHKPTSARQAATLLAKKEDAKLLAALDGKALAW